MCDVLAAISQTYPDLAAKCADLERHLHRFGNGVTPQHPADDDLPF
jgi:hypothetical protein